MIERPTNVTKAVIENSKRLYGEEPKELKDALEYFWNNKVTLYQSAYAMQRKVIDEKLNYRNFGVGAAAVVLNTETNEFEILTGWNSKETPDADKHCAERRILDQATARGFDKIVGILVVAEHQDDPSQINCTTLHPCRVCRNMFRDSSLAWPDMPVVTMSIPPDVDYNELGSYSPVEEQHTLANLMFAHDSALRRKGRDPLKDRDKDD